MGHPAVSIGTHGVPLAESMLVAVCPTDCLALDDAFDARAVHSASKGQRGVSLCMEEDVLLIDGSFQFPLLTGTLVITGDRAALLDELHDLRAVPAIGASRVNCPIAGDVGRWLLGDCDVADSEQKESEDQLQGVVAHGVLEPKFLDPVHYRRVQRNRSRLKAL